MSRRKLARTVLARRTTQILILLSFVGLIAATRARPDTEPGPLLKVFFLADPLVLVATWLSAHAMPLAVFAAAGGRRGPAHTGDSQTLGSRARGLAGRAGRYDRGDRGRPMSGLGHRARALVGCTGHDARNARAWPCLLRLALPAGNGPCHRKPAYAASADKAQRGRFLRDHGSQLHGTQRLVALAAHEVLPLGRVAGGLALLGGHWGLIFDPLVLFYRHHGDRPAARRPSGAVEEGSTAVFQGQPDEGLFRPGVVTEPFYNYLRDNVFTIPSRPSWAADWSSVCSFSP